MSVYGKPYSVKELIAIPTLGAFGVFLAGMGIATVLSMPPLFYIPAFGSVAIFGGGGFTYQYLKDFNSRLAVRHKQRYRKKPVIASR
jgi:hypothetical protein